MSGRVVWFGVFEADLDAAELRKGGVVIRLQEQPFLVLAALLEHPGEVVSRDELRKRLWPDDTFVDFEHSLNVAINKLRDALSDSASSPRFIETVPRRGYRFVGPISGSGDERKPAVEQAAPVTKPPRRGWWMVAAVAVALGVGLAIGGIAFWGRAPSAMIASPLTGDPGQEQEPSLSPDGAHVAYAADPGGQLRYDIYVRTIGSGEARRLTATAAHERNPAWSPDGRQIAFLRWDGKMKAQLVLTPAMGGPERVVATADVTANFFSATIKLLGWFPDGKRLVVLENRDGQTAMAVVNSETGERRALPAPPPGTADSDPAVSGDGRRLAWVRTSRGASDLMAADLSPGGATVGEPKPVIRDGRLYATPVWLPGDREIVFAAGVTHFRQLYRVSAGGGQAVQLPFTGGFHTTWPAVAGTRMVYHTGHYDVNIWRTPLGKGMTPGPAEQVAGSTYIDHYPSLSPDGRRLAFVSNRSGFQELWVGGQNGENALQLTNFRGREVGDPVWLPGNRIGFAAGGDGYWVSADGGAPVLLLSNAFSLAGDGRWILASSAAHGNRISRIALQGGRPEGEPVPLSRRPGGRPRESPDGRWVYFSRGAQAVTLWRIPAAGGTEQLVADQISTSGNWAVTTEGVWFIPMVGEDGHTSVELLDPDTGVRRRVAVVDRIPMWGLTVCPQSACVIYSQADRFESDLMVVENFR